MLSSGVRKFIVLASAVVILAPASGLFSADRPERRLEQVAQILKPDVPRLLCLDDHFATGGQPTDNAYAKAAANGFRSVLSLRTGSEGVDLFRERALVEKANMKYFNIPVISSAPQPNQADEFIRLAKDPSNHPMLINCATANRVGAFMMIYRVLEQGWSEEKALDEAIRIGTTTEALKKFAHDYIAQHKHAG
jgi:protein tyrosine phosphatase (PTP) superfamily phosphohydrolase (DUF442 family)